MNWKDENSENCWSGNLVSRPSFEKATFQKAGALMTVQQLYSISNVTKCLPLLTLAFLHLFFPTCLRCICRIAFLENIFKSTLPLYARYLCSDSLAFCTTLYYTTLHYTVLYYTILYYTILYYTILLIKTYMLTNTDLFHYKNTKNSTLYLNSIPRLVY
jgi:hypothetical protein